MIIVIFFLIIIPILIYLPSPIGIIPQEEAGNVLGYIGALFGGFITFYGVKKTIDYEVKSKQESEKPILICDMDLFNLVQNVSKSYEMKVVLKNVGNYEANNCKIYLHHQNSEKFISNVPTRIQCVPKDCFSFFTVKMTQKYGELTHDAFSLEIFYSGHKGTQYRSLFTFIIDTTNVEKRVNLANFKYE